MQGVGVALAAYECGVSLGRPKPGSQTSQASSRGNASPVTGADNTAAYLDLTRESETL